MINWFSARGDFRSLAVGGTLSMTALVLLVWVQGYTRGPFEHHVVGPFRFVRHPLRLSLWLLAIAFSLGSRSFPGLLISIGLLPCLYHLDLEREERQRPRQSLASYRYSKFVPALVPSIFPYQWERDSVPVQYSWKNAFLGLDRATRGRLLRLLLGWLLIIFMQKDLLPAISGQVAAALWVLLLIIRTIFHRKTLKLVFT